MSKKKILICDDNEDLLDILSLGLKDLPEVELIIKRNGQEILNYINKHESLPSLLIVDLMIPGIEGDDVIKKLRKKKKYEHLPIILISGVIFNIEDRAKAVGANDFLVKPFSIKDLKNKITNYL